MRETCGDGNGWQIDGYRAEGWSIGLNPVTVVRLLWIQVPNAFLDPAELRDGPWV